MSTLEYEVPTAQLDADRLMDVAGVLRDLTRELKLMRGIPTFLASTMELRRVTLALVKRGARGEQELVFVATSAGAAAEAAATKLVLDVSRQIAQPGFSGQNLASLGATTQMNLPEPEGPSTIYQRQVDADHQLILVASAADGVGLELLPLVSNYLAREVRAMLLWEAGPEQLGDPFDRLTSREWVVLCGLNSEDGEKQLADRLGLSPHTLHSHIKSIYRKIGVQGRLPLLQKLNHAQCEYRMLILQPGVDPLRSRAGG